MKTILISIAIGGLIAIGVFSFIYIDLNTQTKKELAYEEFFRFHVSETCPITEQPVDAKSYDPINCKWLKEHEERKILTGQLRPKD